MLAASGRTLSTWCSARRRAHARSSTSFGVRMLSAERERAHAAVGAGGARHDGWLARPLAAVGAHARRAPHLRICAPDVAHIDRTAAHAARARRAVADRVEILARPWAAS